MINERIAIDPKVMAGKPVIRGTRIPVDLIVRRSARESAKMKSLSSTRD